MFQQWQHEPLQNYLARWKVNSNNVISETRDPPDEINTDGKQAHAV